MAEDGSRHVLPAREISAFKLSYDCESVHTGQMQRRRPRPARSGRKILPRQPSSLELRLHSPGDAQGSTNEVVEALLHGCNVTVRSVEAVACHAVVSKPEDTEQWLSMHTSRPGLWLSSLDVPLLHRRLGHVDDVLAPHCLARLSAALFRGRNGFRAHCRCAHTQGQHLGVLCVLAGCEAAEARASAKRSGKVLVRDVPRKLNEDVDNVLKQFLGGSQMEPPLAVDQAAMKELGLQGC